MPRHAHPFVRSFLRLTALLAVPLLATAPVFGQETDDDDPFLPGLVAALRDNNGHTAARVDPQLSFSWGDTAPDPRLDAGKFRATWRGRLRAEARGAYRFFFFGTGEVEMTLDGGAVVARRTLRDDWYDAAPVTLAAGHHPIELSFRRTEKDARLSVFWSGPQFGLEPIPPRLLSHPRERSAGRDFERGRLLARALRCGRCHGDDAPPPAPALDLLAGNLSRDWLVNWLSAGGHRGAEPRRMPALGLSVAQADAVADWLLAPRTAPAPTPADKPSKKADARAGERLFLTLGCLACHTWRDLGAGGWFGGGDLTHVADKRPPSYFAAWLADPARLNRDHRMPVFPLATDERTSLALFLAGQKSAKTTPAPAAGRRDEGRRLVDEFRCASCHRLPEAVAAPPAGARLGDGSDWQHSCLGDPDAARHRPGYKLDAADARAVRLYYSTRRADPAEASDGRLFLAEHNCLACHAREGTREANPLLPPLLADKLAAVARRHPDLAPLLPALTPPALNSVGDKLSDQALTEAVVRLGAPHRPYLQARMPRFPLSDGEVRAVVRHLVAEDRVPPRPRPAPPEKSRLDRYALAGGRLVSSDGFGCTSCHAVGAAIPPDGPLNARGPSLSLLGNRVRREWFDRWVRNPARVVPRMEMPSVEIPVQGVLGGRLDEQLDALWHVLNTPGFDPPAPNPIRTLRHFGHDTAAEPVVLTDLLHYGGKMYLKPFLVGLGNRHNVLLDLEAGALASWTAGDAARQRTMGKAWFWESAGATVLDTGLSGPDLSLLIDDRALAPRPLGQFVIEADAWRTDGPRLTLSHRMKFGDAPVVRIRRTFTPAEGGFAAGLTASPLPAGARLRLQVLSAKATPSPDGREVRLGDRFATRVVLREPAGARFCADGTALTLAPDERGEVRVVLHYLSEIPVDRFPRLPVTPFIARKGDPVEVAPGFVGEKLPLSPEIMPTGLAWRPDGRLVFSSLKGQVFEAVDSDGDGVEDRLALLADGVPAPYGIAAGPGYVDVAAKFALLRLKEEGTSRHTEVIASGWGTSTDYHEWSVGLPRNKRGDYFLGIPCYQDKRSPEAARFHGNVLRLVPRAPTPDDPRLFRPEPISAGHRFPMGLALDRTGELFVTDNQGNYNPFNELNHVRPGVHFGFVNTLDRGKPLPPLTPPAIDIPHPWTRSVNGVCFLDTPKELRARLGRDVFGPLEGHLIGCEYDTRRLIRMTLQRVGDTFQGAAYPLSVPPADPSKGFLGPLVCGVSPKGVLYVGGIRDSGWGAGNNVGEIVRVTIDPDRLPCGVAEVRATRDGFVIDFFRPVDRAAAAKPESYAIQSYRREATPAYGGPDLDRRTEAVAGATVAEDGRRVTLKLAEMRPGFVYELRLRSLTPGGGEFHPAEAHYTLRAVPR